MNVKYITTDYIKFAAWNPDGSTFVTAPHGRSIKVWAGAIDVIW
jgi:hypothetical protein